MSDKLYIKRLYLNYLSYIRILMCKKYIIYSSILTIVFLFAIHRMNSYRQTARIKSRMKTNTKGNGISLPRPRDPDINQT